MEKLWNSKKLLQLNLRSNVNFEFPIMFNMYRIFRTLNFALSLANYPNLGAKKLKSSNESLSAKKQILRLILDNYDSAKLQISYGD